MMMMMIEEEENKKVQEISKIIVENVGRLEFKADESYHSVN